MAFTVFRSVGARALPRVIQGALRITSPQRVLSTSLLDQAVFATNLMGAAHFPAIVTRRFQQMIKEQITTLTPEERLNGANNVMGFGTLAAGLVTTSVKLAYDIVEEMGEHRAESSSKEQVPSPAVK